MKFPWNQSYYPYPAFIGGARVIEDPKRENVIHQTDDMTPEDIIKAADDGKCVCFYEFITAHPMAANSDYVAHIIDRFKKEVIPNFDNRGLDQYEFVLDRNGFGPWFDLYFRKRPANLLPEKDTVLPKYTVVGISRDGVEYEKESVEGAEWYLP